MTAPPDIVHGLGSGVWHVDRRKVVSVMQPRQGDHISAADFVIGQSVRQIGNMDWDGGRWLRLAVSMGAIMVTALRRWIGAEEAGGLFQPMS